MPDYLNNATIRAASTSRGKGIITGDMLDKIQSKVESWALNTEHELQMKVPTNSGDLFNSIKKKVRMRDGFPSSITFGMKRYGVYLEKGAGNGYGGTGKSTWTYQGKKAKGVSDVQKRIEGIRHARTLSIGRMNTGNRLAKPWFNPTIEENISKLADGVAEAMGDVYMDIAIKAIGIQ